MNIRHALLYRFAEIFECQKVNYEANNWHVIINVEKYHFSKMDYCHLYIICFL